MFGLEEQIQKEKNDSGGRFDKTYSMIIFFYKTIEMNGSRYVKFPLRSFVILNIQNDDRFCLLWSILAQIRPIADS